MAGITAAHRVVISLRLLLAYHLRIHKQLLILIILIIMASGCSVLKKKQDPDPDLNTALSRPLTPEQTGEVLTEASENFVLSSGIGGAALNIGTSILFPPYALYLIGNGVLEYAGYEGIYVTDALPEAAREKWEAGYQQLSSVPGRAIAGASGQEFRSEDVVKQRMENLIKKLNRPAPPVILSTYSYTPVMLAELKSYESAVY